MFRYSRLWSLLSFSLGLMIFVAVTVAQMESIPVVTAQQNVNVRETASTRSPIVGALAAGEAAMLFDETPDGEMVSGSSLWYRVQLPSGIEGWLWSGAVTVAEVTLTPTPIPRPTLPPNPDYETITLENAAHVQELDSWGYGMPFKVAWSPDGQQIVVATTQGLYSYDTSNLTAGASLMRTFPKAPFTGQIGFVGSTPNLYLLELTRDDNGQFMLMFETFNRESHRVGAFIKIPVSQVATGMSFGSVTQYASISTDGHSSALIDPIGVRIYDLHARSAGGTINRIEERFFLKLGKQPTAVALSPDGNQLAVSVEDKTSFYSVVNQQLIFEAEGGAEKFLYSPDGSRVILFGHNIPSVMLDTNTGEALQRYERNVYSSFMYEVDLGAGGQEFAVNHGDGVAIYDISNPSPRLNIPYSRNVTGLSFNPDGSQIAGVGVRDGRFTIWNSSNGEVLYQDLSYGIRGPQLTFADNGATLAILGDQIRFAALNTLHPAYEMPTATGGVPSYSSDRILANFGIQHRFEYKSDGYQVLTRSGIPVSEPIEFEDHLAGGNYLSSIGSYGISPDGQTVVFGNYRGRVSIMDGSTLEERKTVYHSFGVVSYILFSTDGRFFVTSGEDSNIYMWTLDGQLIQQFKIPSASDGRGVKELALSADGTRVAASTGDKLFVWDVVSGERFGPFVPPSNNNYSDIVSLTLDPQGQIVATWTIGSGVITLFNIVSESVITELAGGISGGDLAFTPDGSRLLAAGFQDGLIHFWGIRRQPTPTLSPSATPAPFLTTHTPIPTVISTPTPQVLFVETFDSSLIPVWLQDTLHPSLVATTSASILHLENNSDQHMSVTLPINAGDFAAELRLRFLRSNVEVTDLFFGVRESERGGYNANLDVESRAYGIGSFLDREWNDLATATGLLYLEKWLILRMEMRGEVLSLSLNGGTLLQSTDNRVSEGVMSITLAPHTIVEIDDVRITN